MVGPSEILTTCRRTGETVTISGPGCVIEFDDIERFERISLGGKCDCAGTCEGRPLNGEWAGDTS